MARQFHSEDPEVEAGLESCSECARRYDRASALVALTEGGQKGLTLDDYGTLLRQAVVSLSDIVAEAPSRVRKLAGSPKNVFALLLALLADGLNKCPGEHDDGCHSRLLRLLFEADQLAERLKAKGATVVRLDNAGLDKLLKDLGLDGDGSTDTDA